MPRFTMLAALADVAMMCSLDFVFDLFSPEFRWKSGRCQTSVTSPFKPKAGLNGPFRLQLRHFNAELLGVFGVQSLKAGELQGIGSGKASDGMIGEKPIQHIETDVPPR